MEYNILERLNEIISNGRVAFGSLFGNQVETATNKSFLLFILVLSPIILVVIWWVLKFGYNIFSSSIKTTVTFPIARFISFLKKSYNKVQEKEKEEEKNLDETSIKKSKQKEKGEKKIKTEKKKLKLGEILIRHVSKTITEEQILEALEEQKNDPSNPLLGTILFKKEIATMADIELALSYQGKRGKNAKLVM